MGMGITHSHLFNLQKMNNKKNKMTKNMVAQSSSVASMDLLYKECADYNTPKAISKRKEKRILNIVGDIVFGIVLVALCYGIIIVNLTKQKGNVPFIAGYSLEYIETGSMEPTLPIGSVILAKQKTDDTIINIGDIITFYEGYDREKDVPNNRVIVTHRLYSAIIDDNGTLWYTTKGDNNNAPDMYPILFDDVIATFVRRLL